MTGAHDWSAHVGQTWADEWARTERALAKVGAILNDTIAQVVPVKGRVVDIGCGVGSTTLALAAARPGLDILGVDLSLPMVEVARGRATGGRPEFMVGDATEVVPALSPVDALVSRHGVMFFADPRAAFAALASACRPGAPLVFSCFGARAENEWASTVDAVTVSHTGLHGGARREAASGYAPGPFAFADRDVTAAMLADAGWRDVTVSRHDVDYVVGAGSNPVGEALAFYRRIGPAASVLAAASGAERDGIEARLADLFATRIRDGAVTFTAAIAVWTARAAKE